MSAMPESGPPPVPFGVDIANPGFVGQLRQFSVPLLARVTIFTIAVLTLVAGILLIGLGWHACAPDKCGEKWLEVGLQVLGTTFLPVVVLGYLVFAETGVKALVRKSSELLRKTIPDALHLEPSAEDFLVGGELERCEVKTSHANDSPRAYYSLTATRSGEQARLDVILDLNVSKINVVFIVPVPRQGVTDLGKIADNFKATLEGAAHEGYVIDKVLTETEINGRHCIKLVARLRMNDNFLWDPARKLHFAQDLRMFCHAMMVEGWPMLRLS
jgi:hypothetical protein